MRIAVITIAAGRERHLARQQDGLAASTVAPDVRVVEHLTPQDGHLPLARGRNAGAARALQAGAELLVFLDVDCIPAPDLLARYRAAAAADPGALLCGPVGYLPPGDHPLAGLPRLAEPHPARPVPRTGTLLLGGDHRLFWSLSFAVTRATWNQIGGFDEGYTGYGGEDTDFGQRARAAGVGLTWVGGAWAYHQHHETASPPVQHLDDILRNAARFHDRWGWWPMEGWLRAFDDLGLARYDAAAGTWVRCSPALAGR